MPFVEEQPRRIETIEDVEAVLDSPRASWRELIDCHGIAASEGRTDLLHCIAHRQLDIALVHRRPALRREHVRTAALNVLKAFVSLPGDLSEIEAHFLGAIEWVTGNEVRLSEHTGELGAGFTETQRLISEVLLLVNDGTENSFPRLSKRLRKLVRADLAVEACTRATETNPRNIAAWTSMGAAHTDLDEHQEAEAALDTALRLDPDSKQALTSKSRLLDKTGRTSEAVDSALRAFLIEPDTFSARMLLKLSIKTGDSELFYRILAQASEALDSPDGEQDLWIGVLAAEVLFEERMVEKAEALINELLSRSPRGATLRRLGELRDEIRRWRYRQGDLFEENTDDPGSDSTSDPDEPF